MESIHDFLGNFKPIFSLSTLCKLQTLRALVLILRDVIWTNAWEKNSQNKKSQKNGNEKLSEKRRLSHSREVVEIHASHLTCQSRKEIDATQKLCLTYELL